MRVDTPDARPAALCDWDSAFVLGDSSFLPLAGDCSIYLRLRWPSMPGGVTYAFVGPSAGEPLRAPLFLTPTSLATYLGESVVSVAMADVRDSDALVWLRRVGTTIHLGRGVAELLAQDLGQVQPFLLTFLVGTRPAVDPGSPVDLVELRVFDQALSDVGHSAVLAAMTH